MAASAVEERKLVTVLFADLVGSTALGESTDPERMRVVLDRFYDAMAAEIERVGGTIEKFVGDAVMAAFGAPIAHEDHAERALAAALAMQDRLRELFGDRLKLRIGVNTGDVVLGRARQGSSFVSGDAVNVAARLEQAAAPDEILVGERTVAAAGAAFAYGEGRSLAAKGKRLPVNARPLVRALAPRRPRGARGLRSAFVGRKLEIEWLVRAYEATVAGGRPRLVVAVGDPGVGKSRLVAEFVDRLARFPSSPAVALGRCLAYGRQTTYAPLGDVLRQRLGLAESASPADVAAVLGSRQILALALGAAAAEDIHPLVARARFQTAWTEFVAEAAAEHPLVVVIEDAHWAQPQLLELLDELAATGEMPILIVVTSRPELAPAAFARAAAETIRVEPLPAASAAEMAAQLLGSAPPQPMLAALDRAEGNPFFIEEIVASLLDRGLLVRREGAWAVDELPPSAVPDTVTSLLASRIDLLPPREKRALQAAAVVGRRFGRASVEALVGERPDFALLEQREFVARASPSSVADDGEYTLKHALTREVAYAGVPRAARARLHAAYAEWVERERGARDENAPVLAHHYGESLDAEFLDLAWGEDAATIERLRTKALRWLQRAAELAIGRYDIDQVLSLLQRSLELAEDEATTHRLWRAIAAAHALRYDSAGFVSASQRAIDLAPDAPARSALYADLALRTSVAGLMWNPPLEPQVVEAWIESALRGAAAGSADRAKALLARAWYEANADAPAREALAIAERLDDPVLVALGLRGCIFAATTAGRLDEAAAQAERLDAIVGSVSDPGLKEVVMTPTLRIAMLLGNLDDARRHVESIDALIRELTPHHRLHGLAYAVEVEELGACWERVLALEPAVEEAVERNRATPCARNARSLLVCALAHEAAGNGGRAAVVERAAEQLRMEGHVRVLEPLLLRLALLRGRSEELQDRIGRYGAPQIRFTWDIAGVAAWLDAAAALGLREAIEAAATDIAYEATYVEPFVLRAIGIARRDEELIHRADRAFAARGLDWFAQQTPLLVGAATRSGARPCPGSRTD